MTNSIMKYMQEKYPIGIPSLEMNVAEMHACILNIENDNIRENMEILLDIAVVEFLSLSGAKTAIQKMVGFARVPEVMVDGMIFNDPYVSMLFPQLFEEK